MNAVAIIPARGGSRRIPQKNIRPFLGKPVLAYAVEVALASGLFGRGVFVSTEDGEIAKLARQFGAKWHRRDAVLAENGVGTQEVMRNALLELFGREMPKRTCCIYPCSPTLQPSDLIAANMLLENNAARSYVIVEGMFYFGPTNAFLGDVPIEGSGTIRMEDCYRWIDINVPADWHEAARIYRRMRRTA